MLARTLASRLCGRGEHASAQMRRRAARSIFCGVEVSLRYFQLGRRRRNTLVRAQLAPAYSTPWGIFLW